MGVHGAYAGKVEGRSSVGGEEGDKLFEQQKKRTLSKPRIIVIG